MNGLAAEFFVKFAAALAGKIEPSDSPLLASACHDLAEAQRCRAAASKHEPATTDYGRCVRAALAFASAADRTLRDFKVTPADRAKALAKASAHESPVAKVLARPNTALDRVSQEWREAHPGEKFPPLEGTPAAAKFWAIVDEARAAEEAAADRDRTPEERERHDEFNAWQEVHSRDERKKNRIGEFSSDPEKVAEWNAAGIFAPAEVEN